jgi:hypothetical protein
MRAFLATIFVALLAVAAQAQTPSVRVAGTVGKLDGNTLTVNTADGQTTTVMLAASAAIYGMEKRTLADIKTGDYLASGGIKGADGKIQAVEVRIFPEVLRGSGEGQHPWSVKTDGVMTNATVGTVDQLPTGGIIHVTYKGGESALLVTPDVPIVAYVAGDRDLLKPGAAVLIFAQKQPDGTLTADRVAAEKNGVKPPV